MGCPLPEEQMVQVFFGGPQKPGRIWGEITIGWTNPSESPLIFGNWWGLVISIIYIDIIQISPFKRIGSGLTLLGIPGFCKDVMSFSWWWVSWFRGDLHPKSFKANNTHDSWILRKRPWRKKNQKNQIVFNTAMLPRDPGSPKLRMGAWNLNTIRWGGDWTSLHPFKRWLDPYGLVILKILVRVDCFFLLFVVFFSGKVALHPGFCHHPRSKQVVDPSSLRIDWLWGKVPWHWQRNLHRVPPQCHTLGHKSTQCFFSQKESMQASKLYNLPVVSNILRIITPILGEMIQFEHIFQLGSFNNSTSKTWKPWGRGATKLPLPFIAIKSIRWVWPPSPRCAHVVLIGLRRWMWLQPCRWDYSETLWGG